MDVGKLDNDLHTRRVAKKARGLYVARVDLDQLFQFSLRVRKFWNMGLPEPFLVAFIAIRFLIIFFVVLIFSTRRLIVIQWPILG